MAMYIFPSMGAWWGPFLFLWKGRKQGWQFRGLNQSFDSGVIKYETYYHTNDKCCRNRKYWVKTKIIEQQKGDKGPYHYKGAMTNIDHLEHTENKAQSHGGHAVYRTKHKALDQIAE